MKKLKHNWDGVVLPDTDALGQNLLGLFLDLKLNPQASRQIGQLVFEAGWDDEDIDFIRMTVQVLNRQPEEEEEE